MTDCQDVSFCCRKVGRTAGPIFYFAKMSEIAMGILLRQTFFLTSGRCIMCTYKGLRGVTLRRQSIRRRQDGRGANRRQSS